MQGINLPARCVLFSQGWEKFDGKERRLLTTAEYTQMSGRAGRRGIDQQGICITLTSSSSNSSSSSILSHNDEDIQKVLGGGHHLVLSRFALSWTMILNVGRLQSGTLDMQDLISSSDDIHNSYFTAFIPPHTRTSHLTPIPVLACSGVSSNGSSTKPNLGWSISCRGWKRSYRELSVR